MFDPSTLSTDEQNALRDEIQSRFRKLGGDDIDAAIERDRKVLSEHRRELDYVSTLPFDKPYRWRVAPSVGLRAQKDLERQQKRREELMAEAARDIFAEHGYVSEAPSAPSAAAPLVKEVEDLKAFIAEAMQALNDWKQESAVGSPPATAAA